MSSANPSSNGPSAANCRDTITPMSLYDETEADTRAKRIDPVLRDAGWEVVKGSDVRREMICPGRIQAGGRRGKGLSCDYVLFYKGQKLAVLEAKRAGLSHREGVGQAKDYAGRLGARFAYASNGLRWYGIDMATGAEGDIGLPFSTPDELWNRTFAEPNPWRDAFGGVPFEDRRRQVGGPLLPAQGHRGGAGGHRAGRAAHPADARHGDRQDLHRLPDRLEAVPRQVEPRRRGRAPPAHPVPGRPQYPRRPGLQRLLRLPAGRRRAHRSRLPAQEGRQGAEERQRLLHHLTRPS